MTRAPHARRRTAIRIGAVAAVGSVALAALAGCAPGPVSAMTLTVGSLMPLTSSVLEDGRVVDSTPGPGYGAEAGVQLAIDDINAAGTPLTVEGDFRDAGDTDNGEYEKAIDAWSAEDSPVSVVIGPLGGDALHETATTLTADDGPVVISPGDTTNSSTEWATNGRYFRTAAPETAQGQALADLMWAEGRRSLIIVAADTNGGAVLAQAIWHAFDDLGGTTANILTYQSDLSNYNAPVDQALAEKTDAVVYIGDDETEVFVQLSVAAGFPASQIYFPARSLNEYDSSEDGTFYNLKGVRPADGLTEEFEDRVNDAYHELHPERTKRLKTYTDATEAYDATVVAALAAIAARSTEPSAIAAKVREVTGGGAATGDDAPTTCTTFADCAALLMDDQKIDYDGVSGVLDLGEDGAPTSASMSVWTYKKHGGLRQIAASLTDFIAGLEASSDGAEG